MTIGWLTIWLLSLGAIGLLVSAFARRLIVLRREVHQLAADKPLSENIPGPRILREIHQDLKRVAERQRQIARRIADEDFSLRAILTSMVEGVLIADSDLRIRLANDRLQAMFALSRPAIHRTVMEVFRNHLLHQVIEETLRTEEPRFAELQVDVLEEAQFQVKHFQVTSVSLRPRDHESKPGALVIFHDITQLRSLEAVRKEFVANVSHELRTPLSIITGYLETLIEHGEDKETTLRFLKTMHKHAQRLNLLVEDLLTISQLESRKVSLEFQPMSFADCVTRVLDRLDSRVRESRATFSVNMPDDLPLIEADPFRIEQAVFNLVENAIKYGDKPGNKISIDAVVKGHEVIINVSDNGPGIPLSDQPHIFERFYRVQKDRSRDAGGTGLGLSIVKHTVQAHGGSVSVRSLPGSGASFTVVLPLEQN
ncbi:MAG: PAS domain-containing protein [Verrucomicrobia bacterium]|nr:PAS domain-containing protein [Verrucomicrobiota bacterium]